MASSGRHVVVIGAGIVGVSSAFYIRQRGWEVTLVDPLDVGSGASSGNAGVIAVSECVPVGTPGMLKSLPRMLLSSDGPLHIRPAYFPRLLPWLLRMLRASKPAKVESLSISLASILDKALDAHRELARAAGVEDSIVRSGWLKAFETESGFKGSRGDFELMRRRGVECEELNAEGVARLEPALKGKFSRAVFHPDCHHVGDPFAYVQALGRHVVKMGVNVIKDEVRGFEMSAGRVTAVRTQGHTIFADAVVMAAGAWSQNLAKQLGCNIPLDTERGYHMMLDASGCAVRLSHPLYWADKAVVISPMGDALRVTSSVEFAGLHAAPNFDLVLRCLPDIQSLLPGVRLLPNSAWLGFRPSMPDSLPVIGPVPDVPNAFLAFGHGHVGLTLGPVTGKLVGELLDGVSTHIPIEPFSPSRFSGSKV